MQQKRDEMPPLDPSGIVVSFENNHGWTQIDLSV
jgi:hypothetical protein